MIYIILTAYLAFLAFAEWKRDVIFALGAMLTSGIAMTSTTLTEVSLLGVEVFTLPTLMFILALYVMVRQLLVNRI